MKKPMYYTTEKDLKGNEIAIYSKKQEVIFYKEIKNNETNVTKICHQYPDGTIILHKFFGHEDKWLGYALEIGPKGGVKSYHKFYTMKIGNTLYLVPKD